MSTQPNKKLIGAFVIGAIGLIVAGMLVFGTGRFFSERKTLVMYFDGSVKGLSVGAPVVFQGVQIGQVKHIKLLYEGRDMSIQIPVIAEIDPNRFTEISGRELTAQEFRNTLIARGLKAQLVIQSLVTGQLMIQWDFFPDREVRLKGDGSMAEMPTVPSSLEEISRTLDKIPIDDLAMKILDAIDGFERFINSPAVTEGVESFDQMIDDIRTLVNSVKAKLDPMTSKAELTVEELRRLVQRIDSQIEPLAADIQKAVTQARAVMRRLDGRIDPLADDLGVTLETARSTMNRTGKILSHVDHLTAEDSQLQYELINMLQEISAAARSARVLADYLEKNPEALLRGKKSSGAR